MTTTTYDGNRTDRRGARPTEMTSAQRLLVGGLGGITPIVATMMAGEYQNLPLPDYQGLQEFYIGYCLRIALFFCVGALFVWLHQEVKGRYPVFRLGVTAPALIAAMISATPADAGDSRNATAFGDAAVHLATLRAPVDSITLPDALPVEFTFRKRCSILDGFLGRKCKKPRSESGNDRAA